MVQYAKTIGENNGNNTDSTCRGFMFLLDKIGKKKGY